MNARQSRQNLRLRGSCSLLTSGLDASFTTACKVLHDLEQATVQTSLQGLAPLGTELRRWQRCDAGLEEVHLEARAENEVHVHHEPDLVRAQP